VAILRDRPYANSNFLVDFGNGKVRAVTAGFSEVIFPEFVIAGDEQSAAARAEQLHADSVCSRQNNHLVLKRGVIGSLDLYDWWNKTRRGKAPKRRILKIQLLSEDHDTIVLTWRFYNVRPVTLAYSPLRANESGIVIETLELAFDRMEMQ
jgi:phage tail-like protein